MTDDVRTVLIGVAALVALPAVVVAVVAGALDKWRKRKAER